MDNINTNFHLLWVRPTIENPMEDKLYVEYRRQWHNNPVENIVSDFPLFLDIEATSVCNLKCPDCVQTSTKFKKGFMDFNLYKKIIDEASDNGCYGCKFHCVGRGEPLMHRDIVKMVAYAKKKGLIDVYLNTNGVLLNIYAARALLDAGLDRISFSIDGFSRSIYEKYRPGAKFINIAYKIVPDFFFLRETGNYKTKIRIQTINFPDVDLDFYPYFWKTICDEVAYIDYKNMGERKFGLKSDWICPQPWQRMGVLYDGWVIPCNHDDRGYAILGNANMTSISRLWNSSEMKYIRETHRRNKAHLLSACDGCYLRTSCIENL